MVVVVVVVSSGTKSRGKDAFFGGAHRASFAAVTRAQGKAATLPGASIPPCDERHHPATYERRADE
jgi:hypothetical protein